MLACLPVAAAMAQTPGALLTFSQPEITLSMGGGPLQVLHPNEIAFLPLPPGCPNGPLTEKWSPRTCFHVMAGDENGDGQYWNPNLFGSIDALSTGFGFFWQTNSIGKVAPNPRMVFWSPSAVMGNHINSPTNITPSLRPGDIGRILPNGTVELLMSEAHFRTALGCGPSVALDIDAFAYEPGLGIYFSLDGDTLCQLACSSSQTNWVNDGSVLAIPWSAVTHSVDYRITWVQANCVHEVINEGFLNVYMANAGVTDRNGASITLVVDLESLDIDHGPGTQVTTFSSGCSTVLVPDFLFSTESMTCGSLISTKNYGQPAMGPCGALGLQQPFFQNGYALGIQQQLANVGPASYVNALALGTTERLVLEPAQHQLNYGGAGGLPTMVHVGGEFDYIFTWIDVVPNTIAPSGAVPSNLFPDWYCLNLTLWDFGVTVNGFDSFAGPNIPVGWSGKLVFQSIGFDAASNSALFNVSTPCVIDVN